MYEISFDDIAHMEKVTFYLEEGMRIIARYQRRFVSDLKNGWYSGTVAMRPSSLTRDEYLVNEF